MFSYCSFSLLYIPVLPAIMFVSKYTGYTGSVIATPVVGEAIKKATDEMLKKETFHGYGPEQGYDFLREKIVKYDYEKLGINIEKDEIFVSDGWVVWKT